MNGSMTSIHERNTEGIRAHAQEKSQKTKRKVDEAIRELLQGDEQITFGRIATLSGVSRSYLYTHTEVRERVEALRQQQAGRIIAQRASQTRTAASRDVLLIAKDRRIKELEAENRRLKNQLKVALGKIYEQ